jgi:hypothetical protein
MIVAQSYHRPPETSAFHPLRTLCPEGQDRLMRFLGQPTKKFVWWAISIGCALTCAAVQIWAVVNATDFADNSFRNLRTVEGFILWCAATGSTYKLYLFARDKAGRIETSDRTLRTARIGALILLGLGLANFGLWHRAVLGLSQTQVLILATGPAFIVAYFKLAYGNPTDH